MRLDMEKAGEGSDWSKCAESLPALESLLLLLVLTPGLGLSRPTGRLGIIFCGAGAASRSDESFLGGGSGRSFWMLGDDGDEEVPVSRCGGGGGGRFGKSLGGTGRPVGMGSGEDTVTPGTAGKAFEKREVPLLGGLPSVSCTMLGETELGAQQG